MFSPDIVDSDAFLDMSPTAQNLYFHLGMRADDDGFVNPKKIMRVLGTPDDDLKILLAKRFLLPFKSGVVVIKHWLIHNLIRSDLYKETMYLEEKNTLGLKDNGAYTELRDGVAPLLKIEAPEWLKRRRGELRTVNVPQTVPRLGKVRLGKVSTTMSANADVSFSKFWEIYPKKELKKKAQDIWKSKKLDSQVTEILAFIEKARESDRWKRGYVKQPTAFLNGECWNDDLASYSDRKEEPLEIKRY